MLWGRTGDLLADSTRRFSGNHNRKPAPGPFSSEELIRRAIPRTLLEGVLAAHGNVVLA